MFWQTQAWSSYSQWSPLKHLRSAVGHLESQLCFFGWALLCVWDLGWTTWTHPAPCCFSSPSRLTWPCSHERAGIQEIEWKYIGPHEAWFRSDPLISKSQDQFKHKRKGNGLHISMGRTVVYEYKRRRTVAISANDLPHSPLWSKLSRTFIYKKRLIPTWQLQKPPVIRSSL